jgi:hypothetical protein
MFRKKARFYSEDLSAPRTAAIAEDRPLSATRACLFNIFAATMHTECSSSIRKLRTRHTVVTGTNLSRSNKYLYQKFKQAIYRDIILSDNLHH